MDEDYVRELVGYCAEASMKMVDFYTDAGMDIIAVVELLDKLPDKRNVIISPGCDMPYDVALENTIACSQAVKNTEQIREMIRDYAGPDLSGIEVALPDYENPPRPLIEVLTLDSE